MGENRDPQEIRRDPEYLEQHLDKLLWDLANIAWYAPGEHNEDLVYSVVSSMLQSMKERQAIKDFATHLMPPQDGHRCNIVVQPTAAVPVWCWVVTIPRSGPHVGSGSSCEDIWAAMRRQREEWEREQEWPSGSELKKSVLNQPWNRDKLVFELGFDPTGKACEDWPTLEELLTRNSILSRRFDRVTEVCGE